MVSVEVCAGVSEFEEKPHVAGSMAPAGAATLQVRATVPANPPDPRTLMVVELPVVAPGLRLKAAALLLSVNVPGVAGAFTVTVTVVVCVMPPEMPVTVAV